MRWAGEAAVHGLSSSFNALGLHTSNAREPRLSKARCSPPGAATDAAADAASACSTPAATQTLLQSRPHPPCAAGEGGWLRDTQVCGVQQQQQLLLLNPAAGWAPGLPSLVPPAPAPPSID